MLIKRICLYCVLILLIFSSTAFAMPAFLPDQGVYVFETKSGDVVYSQNATQQFEPASTTKLMTSLVLLDYVTDLNEVIVVGDEVNDYDWSDSKAGLWQGEQLSYIQLLHALLLPSGNDAAGTIAINVGRKILNNPQADKQTATEAFVTEMNNKASEMGLKNTHFINPSGSPVENHYSSPADMAKIADLAFDSDIIKEVTATLKYPLPSKTGGAYEIYNTDQNLYPTVAGPPQPTTTNQNNTTAQTPVPTEVPNPFYTSLIQHGKTGTTLEGERTFVFLSEQNGAEVIGVIFKNPSTDIFNQSKQVAEDLNANYKITEIGNNSGYQASAQLENVHFQGNGILNFSTDEAVFLYGKNNVKDNYSLNIRWNNNVIQDSDETLKLVNTINAGDKVGALIISDSSNVVRSVPVYASDQLVVKNWMDNYYIDVGIAIGIVAIIGLIVWLISKKRKIKFQKFENK